MVNFAIQKNAQGGWGNPYVLRAAEREMHTNACVSAGEVTQTLDTKVLTVGPRHQPLGHLPRWQFKILSIQKILLQVYWNQFK